MRKNTVITILLLVNVLVLVPPAASFFVNAADSGYVVIYSPSSNGEYPFWEGQTIYYRVIVRSGWLFESTKFIL